MELKKYEKNGKYNFKEWSKVVAVNSLMFKNLNTF